MNESGRYFGELVKLDVLLHMEKKEGCRKRKYQGCLLKLVG